MADRCSQDARVANTERLNDYDLAVAGEVLREIRERVGFLLNVGLHYLTMDRAAPSLSGGEAQRIRLASQIGSGLVGVMYNFWTSRASACTSAKPQADRYADQAP
jgi:excinuclease ABC subunit A